MRNIRKNILVALIISALSVPALVVARADTQPEVVSKEPVKVQQVEKPVEKVEKPVEPVEKPVPKKTTTHVVPTEDLLESIVNDERSRQGLSRYRTNTLLRSSACAKARHMIANGYWAHNAPDGTPWYSFISSAGYSYSLAGENLAKGFSNGTTTLQGWLNSPTHRANVLNPTFQEQGICSINGQYLGVTQTLTVQHLGIQ